MKKIHRIANDVRALAVLASERPFLMQLADAKDSAKLPTDIIGMAEARLVVPLAAVEGPYMEAENDT